jgi:hypothetical protein
VKVRSASRGGCDLAERQVQNGGKFRRSRLAAFSNFRTFWQEAIRRWRTTTPTGGCISQKLKSKCIE